jgi:hypothetical protein
MVAAGERGCGIATKSSKQQQRVARAASRAGSESYPTRQSCARRGCNAQARRAAADRSRKQREEDEARLVGQNAMCACCSALQWPRAPCSTL